MDTDYGPLGEEFSEFISLNELKITLDLGLIHKQAIASNNTGLLCLCHMLWQEL